MSENKYALVLPTNSLRLMSERLDHHKIHTDIMLSATAHAQASHTYKEPKYELDATWLMTSQPTLIFHGKNWLKRRELLEAITKLNIRDVPMDICELLLPSSYDGERHRTVFARLTTHSRMFKKMVIEGKIPYKRLEEIFEGFMNKIKDRTSIEIYRYLKVSPMIMVDVNPGKAEMFNKDFVFGLRQPFMRHVFTTEMLWKCTDYEVL